MESKENIYHRKTIHGFQNNFEPTLIHLLEKFSPIFYIFNMNLITKDGTESDFLKKKITKI